MKLVYFFVALIVFILLLVFCLSNYNKFQKKYFSILKKSGIVVAYDKNGMLDGEAVEYLDGVIVQRLNYRNGIVEGWGYRYYSNGCLKTKFLFKRNQLDGKQCGYYENGRLKYVGNNKDGKPYGGMRWYSENGNLESYGTFDILGEKFMSFQYDSAGKIKLVDMPGFVVSNKFYSFHEETDSLIVLNNDEKNIRHNGILDLYMTVSIPPGYFMDVSVIINDTMYSHLPIKDNTIKIPHAFPGQGTYDIFVESHLWDKEKKSINGINIKARFIKE